MFISSEIAEIHVKHSHVRKMFMKCYRRLCNRVWESNRGWRTTQPRPGLQAVPLGAGGSRAQTPSPVPCSRGQGKAPRPPSNWVREGGSPPPVPLAPPVGALLKLQTALPTGASPSFGWGQGPAPWILKCSLTPWKPLCGGATWPPCALAGAEATRVGPRKRELRPGGHRVQLVVPEWPLGSLQLPC